jgi:hypothetical protein
MFRADGRLDGQAHVALRILTLWSIPHDHPSDILPEHVVNMLPGWAPRDVHMGPHLA